MPSKHDPADCLADIVENAEWDGLHIAGMDRSDFEMNGLVRDAVERCLERICEAAYRMGSDAETIVPGQPWGQIQGRGNRLRHAYDRITIDIVWHTARFQIPSLEADAREALAKLRPDDVEER